MLKAVDTYIFGLINKGCSNPLLDLIMPFITALGSGEFLFVVSVIIILFGRKNKSRAGILLLAGLTATYYASSFFKGWVARPRPFVSLPDVRALVAESGFSFPSSHATQAFMSAMVLSVFFRNRALFFALAIAVGFSRIYLGVHYASDVIAGALLGAAIGYALTKFAGSLKPVSGANDSL